jgi:RNA polymerase sigma-70 factor (ECF subfamily)
MKVTRNLAIDKLRSKKNFTDEITPAMHISDKTPAPDHLAEMSDIMNIIKKAVSELPEKQKLTFHLREIEGMSYKEICEVLNISIDEVKVNLHRARKKLRKNITIAESYGIR